MGGWTRGGVIDRYILVEMLPPFVLNLLFFTFIFLLTRILEITDMIVNYRVGIGVVGLLLVYSMPYFLVYVIPMSVMMAVLLTFLRMSGDNEILALKSGGVSLYRLLRPVVLFSVAGAALTALMIIQGLPWGRQSLGNLTREVASASLDIGLKERTFNDSFEGVVFYVSAIDPRDRILSNIFIRDQRNKKAAITIIAPRGRLFLSRGGAFQFRLFSGVINTADLDRRTVNSARFDTYDIHLDMGVGDSGRGSRKWDEKSMHLDELIRVIRERPERDVRYWEAVMEYHKKFSIPFACVALGLLAVPLGVGSKFSRPSFGLGLGLTFFLGYYLLLSAGLVFGETGAYPPLIGMWMPNVVMGGLGIYLLIRAANDRPMLFGVMSAGFYRFRSFFTRLLERRRGA